MTEIRRILGWRHLRTEPTMFAIQHRSGKIVRKGQGLSFWFWALSSSVSVVPMDNRDVTFQFHGSSRDRQDVVVQGVVTYRVIDPSLLAQRVDFSIQTTTGAYCKRPLEALAESLVQLAQQISWSYVATRPLREILEAGFEELREGIDLVLSTDEGVRTMGIEVVAVRISAIQPTPEVERALRLPTLEKIQQQADEATFQRRALAVEKERAIAENEAQTKLELARREEEFIEQRGRNERRKNGERVAAERIAVEGNAAHELIRANASAEAHAVRQSAEVAAERERMAIYAQMPTEAMIGLAARELATKLERIEHLSITPELLGPLFTDLMRAGVRRLEAEDGE